MMQNVGVKSNPRFFMAKAAFSKKETIVCSKLHLKKFKEESGNRLDLEHSSVLVVKHGQFGKLRNVMLEKDGEDQLDRSCKK